MLSYSEKIEFNDMILEIEIIYKMMDENRPVYLYHTFFALKDGKAQEEFPEELIDVVQNFVNDVFENKKHRLGVYA